MRNNGCDQSMAGIRTLEKKVGAAGWGLFFMWVGIALFANVGWAAGLFGVGVVMLGTQGARKYFALGLEGFSVVVGSLFVLGGIWELLHVPLNLAPILCVLAGLSLLVSALLRRARG